MYLPTRYSTIWTPTDIEGIICGKEKYYLVKNGVSRNRSYTPGIGKGVLSNGEKSVI
jgi:hypothetical protein